MNLIYWSGPILILLCFLIPSVWSEKCDCVGESDKFGKGKDCKDADYCYVEKEVCRKEGFECFENPADVISFADKKKIIHYSITDEKFIDTPGYGNIANTGVTGRSYDFCKSLDKKVHLTKFCRCLEKNDEQGLGKTCNLNKGCYVNKHACHSFFDDMKPRTSVLTPASDPEVIRYSFNICGNVRPTADSVGSYQLVGNGWCTKDGERIYHKERKWIDTSFKDASKCKDLCDDNPRCEGYLTEDDRKCQIFEDEVPTGVDDQTRNYCWKQIKKATVLKHKVARRCECANTEGDSCIVKDEEDCQVEGVELVRSEGKVRSKQMLEIEKNMKRLGECRCLGTTSCHDIHDKGTAPYCIVHKDTCTEEDYIVTPVMNKVFASDTSDPIQGKGVNDWRPTDLGFSQDFCKRQENRHKPTEIFITEIKWEPQLTIPAGVERTEKITVETVAQSIKKTENEYAELNTKSWSKEKTTDWRISGGARFPLCGIPCKIRAEYGQKTTDKEQERQRKNKIFKTMNKQMRSRKHIREVSEVMTADKDHSRTIYRLRVTGMDSEGNEKTILTPLTGVGIDDADPSRTMALKYLALENIVEDKTKIEDDRKGPCSNCIIV